MSAIVDHGACPPGAHDRDPGTSIEDGQPVDEHGLMLCRDCLAPVMFCTTINDYAHVDPTTAPCFLVPGTNRTPTLRSRNLGDPVRRITAERPWLTTRDDPDGTRWNFWWCGHPQAYVYSPDRPLIGDETLFAERPDEAADGSVTQRLQRRTDAWLPPDPRTD